MNTKPIHGQHKPNDLPADATDTPPVECAFKVGDKVTFTNDYGVVFKCHTVRGFSPTIEVQGRFVYIFTDAWWFPVSPETLKHRA